MSIARQQGQASPPTLFSADVEIITRATNYCNLPPRGTLTVTYACVSFEIHGGNGGGDVRRDSSTASGKFAHLHHCKNQMSCSWNTHAIVGMAQRYYQLSFVALELFFVDRSSLFINLHSASEAGDWPPRSAIRCTLRCWAVSWADVPSPSCARPWSLPGSRGGP